MNNDMERNSAAPLAEWVAPVLILVGTSDDVINLSGANVENFSTSDS